MRALLAAVAERLLVTVADLNVSGGAKGRKGCNAFFAQSQELSCFFPAPLRRSSRPIKANPLTTSKLIQVGRPGHPRTARPASELNRVVKAGQSRPGHPGCLQIRLGR